jgi:quercetin dioxygenase-like cupin family protein
MTALIIILGALSIGAGFGFAKISYPPVHILLSSETDILGQKLVYPKSAPKITAAIVTMKPGEETGLHKHDVPLFAYVLEGEVTVNYGAGRIKVYRKSDAFIEAYQSPHNGKNTSKGVTRILAVFVGTDGIKNTELVK